MIFKADTTVRCLQCKREARVSLMRCLRSGWPECCGRTMLLVSTPSEAAIDAAVRQMEPGARMALRGLDADPS